MKRHTTSTSVAAGGPIHVTKHDEMCNLLLISSPQSKLQTIYASILDPHVTTFGNRLPAHTILFNPEGLANNWLKLEWVYNPYIYMHSIFS